MASTLNKKNVGNIQLIYLWMNDLISLFNGISIFVSYFMPKPCFQKNNNDII